MKRKWLSALLSGALAAALTAAPVSAASVFTGETVDEWAVERVAVSYTHLDVYKRQADGDSAAFSLCGRSQTYSAGTAAGDTTAALQNGQLYIPLYHLAETFG